MPEGTSVNSKVPSAAAVVRLATDAVDAIVDCSSSRSAPPWLPPRRPETLTVGRLAGRVRLSTSLTSNDFDVGLSATGWRRRSCVPAVADSTKYPLGGVKNNGVWPGG